MEQTKRFDYIDILRAIGIIMMIMGHVGFGGKFDRYIHTFHMPVFFLISGFLFKSKSDIPAFKLIGKKAVRLLLPYVAYAMINYVFWLLLEWDRLSNPLWALVPLATYNTQNLPIAGALWFLTALFWCEAFYILADRVFISKPVIRTAIVMANAVAVSFVQNSTTFRLPLAIDIGIVCMGFYELGRCFKGREDKLTAWLDGRSRPVRLGIFGAAFIVNAGLAFVNDYVNVKSGWYGIVPLFWINAVLGSFMIYLAARWFDRITAGQNAGENIFRSAVIRIGRGSIVFMGLNQLIILIFELAAGALNIIETGYIRSIAVFVFTMPVLYVIYILLNRIENKKIRAIFGL